MTSSMDDPLEEFQYWPFNYGNISLFCNTLFILSSNFFWNLLRKILCSLSSREKILVFEHCTNEIYLSDKPITGECQMSKVSLVLQPRSVEHFPLWRFSTVTFRNEKTAFNPRRNLTVKIFNNFVARNSLLFAAQHFFNTSSMDDRTQFVCLFVF